MQSFAFEAPFLPHIDMFEKHVCVYVTFVFVFMFMFMFMFVFVFACERQ